jgi:hypothetical protein
MNGYRHCVQLGVGAFITKPGPVARTNRKAMARTVGVLASGET